jgi:transposase InsO family protein
VSQAGGKNKRIVAVVQKMETLKVQVREPYRPLCSVSHVGYSSFMRWKGRIRRDLPVVRPAGPKKIEAVDLGRLEAEIEALRHRIKRSGGTGALYRRWSSSISRRKLQAMVRTTREAMKAERRRGYRRIEWKVPGLCWSMDSSKLGLERLYQVHDLKSRFKLPPLLVDRLSGETVARHLERLFKKFGSPLILKRDNGGDLDCEAVNEVLSKHGVIPLNSPAYYPRYNGAMERAVQEVKKAIEKRIPSVACSAPVPTQILAELCDHELNQKGRRSLKGKNACQVFAKRTGPMKHYGKKKRKEAVLEIKKLALMILEELQLNSPRAAGAALRTATETWLQQNGLIAVTINQSVTPLIQNPVS